MIAGDMLLLASFLSPSFGELALVGIIALLLYGSDLPQVIRSWGKTYSEFRRHLNGMRSELNDAIYTEPESPRRLQYYPEFQHGARDADEVVSDNDGASQTADEDTADATSGVADAKTIRHDTHGAA